MRTVRALGAALVALAVLPHLVTAGGAGAATGGDPAAIWQADFDRCLAESRSIAVLFLIDESYSLRQGPGGAPGSDVDGQRVEAVKGALAGLSAIAKGDRADRQKVFVALDGFGKSYKQHGSRSWTELDEGSLGGLQKQAEAFRARNGDEWTDYREALRGAADAMDGFRRDVAGGAASGSCSVVLWFTDGDYDTETDFVLVPAEVGQIDAEICAAGTAADRLRAAGVHLIAVALSGQGQLPDFGQLRRIAQAEGGCGAEPRRGTVIEANTDNLVQQIVRSSLGFTAAPRRTGSCATPSDACSEFRFRVDPWVTSFRLLIESDRPGLTATLSGPADSGRIGRDPGSVFPGVSREPVTSSRSLVIGNRDAVAPGGWSGEWVVRFEGNGADKSSADLRIIGDVEVAFDGDAYDREGTDSLVLLVTPKESAVESSRTQAELGNLEVDVAFRGLEPAGNAPPVLRKRVTEGGRVTITASELKPVLDKLGPAAKLGATVTPQGTVTVRPEGAISVPLPPVEVSIRLKLGSGYPILGGSVIEGFENSAEGTLTVPVTGPKEGSGLVEIPSELALVDDPSFMLTVRGDRTCTVPAGTVTSCTWELRAARTANLDGNLEVPLKITGTAVDATTPLAAEEVVELSMTRPMNSLRGFGTLALLVVLFALTQLALRVWNVLETARFRAVDPTTRLIDQRILLRRDGRLDGPDGGSLTVAASDLKFATAFTEPFVEQHAAGLRFSVSRARAFIRLPRDGTVAASSPVFTKRGFMPTETGTPTTAPIPFALRNEWVVVLDDATPAGSDDTKHGRLFALVLGSDEGALEERVAEIVRQVSDCQAAPKLFAALESAASASAVAVPVVSDGYGVPSGGSPADPPPPPAAPPVLDDPYR